MARQIEPRRGEPRLAILDRHLAELDARLALATEAVQVLIRELQSHQMGEPDQQAIWSAAQRANELLIESQRRS